MTPAAHANLHHTAKAAAVGAADVVLQPCAPVAEPAHWPDLQVLALYHPAGQMGSPARDEARRLARQVLAAQAGQSLASRLLALPRHQRGGQAASMAHEPGMSLLAWCATGAVGVDLVALSSLADTSMPELQASAALYLGPVVAQAVARSADVVTARRSWAGHWAAMEARLKCLGLELDEWRPQRAARLAEITCAPLQPVARDGTSTNGWVGCVAWRAASR